MAHVIKHFLTITNHRHKVIYNCARSGILLQGLKHDLSKYSLTEFVPGAIYFQGNRSPNEKERELFGYSKSWLHHKGRNRHHFEYWNDYNPKTKRVENVEMPIRFVVEMFCDRVAASKIYNGKNYTDAHPYQYFLRIKGKGKLHPKTEELLNHLLTMLRDEGEKKTFAYIKAFVKKCRKEKNKKF